MNSLETAVLRNIGESDADGRRRRDREKSRRWRAANPEKFKAISNRWKEYRKEWHAKNKEKVSQRHKDNYQKNKIKILERQKLKRAENLEVYKERAKQSQAKRRAKRLQWWHEYKAALKCSRCDESRAVCLDFHHIEPRGKELGFGKHVYNPNIPKERILKEIEKCIVLCANCHRVEHANGK